MLLYQEQSHNSYHLYCVLFQYHFILSAIDVLYDRLQKSEIAYQGLTFQLYI